MARPKSDNPRCKGLRIRLTDEEYNKWKDIADFYEIDISDLVRAEMEKKWEVMQIARLHYERRKRIDALRAQMTEEEWNAYVENVKNWNQFIKKCKKET